jgi:xanthine dehydrogenase accessory factor
MKRPVRDFEIYETLARMTSSGKDGVLATVVRTHLSTPRHEGSKMIVHPDGSVTGSVGGGRCEARVIEEAMVVFQERSCRRLELDLAKGLGVCGGRMEVFLEPVLRSVPFIVIGAGHVGRAMVEVGRSLPFTFVLVDDRPEFLEPWQAEPMVKTVLSRPDELGGLLEITERSALLVASRNHELDAAYLETVLRAEITVGCCFPFLGVLGSRSKASRITRMIGGLGEPFAARMKTVQMPVGLDIAAETPQEIALSIFVEALAVLRGVKPLCDEQGLPVGIPLHRHRPDKIDPGPSGETA